MYIEMCAIETPMVQAARVKLCTYRPLNACDFVPRRTTWTRSRYLRGQNQWGN